MKIHELYAAEREFDRQSIYEIGENLGMITRHLFYCFDLTCPCLCLITIRSFMMEKNIFKEIKNHRVSSWEHDLTSHDTSHCQNSAVAKSK